MAINTLPFDLNAETLDGLNRLLSALANNNQAIRAYVVGYMTEHDPADHGAVDTALDILAHLPLESLERKQGQ